MTNQNRPERVLVSGANGFLGKNLVHALQDSYRVNCLVRDRNYRNNKATVYYFQTYEDASFEESISYSDVVIHCAAMLHGRNTEMVDTNVRFTRMLCSLARRRGISHFIFISTENVQQGNRDLYTVTKRRAEDEVRMLKQHTILRPTVLYGPGDRKYVTRLTQLARKLPMIPILGTGKNRFQFLYVEDLVQVIKASFQHGIYGTYVVAGPESISYNEFMGKLLRILGLTKPIFRVPIPILKPLSYVLELFFRSPPLTHSQLENLRKDRNYAIDETTKLFDYSPTPLEDGLRKLVAEGV